MGVSMRLWHKIFICTLVLVIAAVDITAALLLSRSYDTMLEREKQRAVTEHGYLLATLRSQVLYKRVAEGRILLNEDEILGIAGSITPSGEDNAMALYRDGKMVSGALPCTEETVSGILGGAAAEKSRMRVTAEGERTYLLIGTPVTLEQNAYELVSVSDITAVYRLMQEQLRFVQWISVCCALVAGLVLLGMVWLLLRPLQRVNRGMRRIARGQYGLRVRESGSRELRELSGSLNTMAQAIEENVENLEQVAEDRKVFIANMAHEMKTPLTSILGFADILRVKREVSDAERREYAGIIVEEARRLKALSGRLMELLSVGSTRPEWSVDEIKALFEQTVLALVPLAQAAQVSLKWYAPDGCRLRVDRELWKSLLSNLIENAVKASKPGSCVLVGARAEDGGVLLVVQDEGIGIPEKELKKIRQPFYMVDKARSRRAGGAGLGLALCEEIARLHGARLTIDSAVGVGTRVSVFFPGGDIPPENGEGEVSGES